MRKSDGAGDAAGDVGKTANPNAKNVSETNLHDKTKGDMPDGSAGIKKLKFDDDDLVYGPSADGNLVKMKNEHGGKILGDFGGPYDHGFDNWLDFSKDKMNKAIENGNKIHFDLTHMGDISGVLNNTGKYADSVTSGELRYIRDNWAKFNEGVKFYKNGMEVPAPWIK